MTMDVKEDLTSESIYKVMASIYDAVGLPSNPEAPPAEHKDGEKLPFYGCVYTDIVYARFVEYGTRPALDSSKVSLSDVCKDESNKRF